MMTFDIPSWTCPQCGYTQDFEPTQEAMDEHFNLDANIALTDVQAHECPSCRLRGEINAMVKNADGEGSLIQVPSSDEFEASLNAETVLTGDSVESEEQFETGRYVVIGDAKQPVMESRIMRTPTTRLLNDDEKAMRRSAYSMQIGALQAKYKQLS